MLFFELFVVVCFLLELLSLLKDFGVGVGLKGLAPTSGEEVVLRFLVLRRRTKNPEHLGMYVCVYV